MLSDRIRGEFEASGGGTPCRDNQVEDGPPKTYRRNHVYPLLIREHRLRRQSDQRRDKHILEYSPNTQEPARVVVPKSSLVWLDEREE